MRKILIVTPINPEARDTGSKLRIFYLARHLRAKGFVVYMLVCDNTSLTGQSLANLRAICADIRFAGAVAAPTFMSKIRRLSGGRPIPFYPEIGQAIKTCVDDWQPDTIMFEKTFTAAQADLAALKSRGIRLLLEEGGVHHVSYLRRAAVASSFSARWVERIRAWRLERYERRLLDEVDAVTAVSRDEADLLRKMHEHVQIILAPNGVDERLVEGAVAGQESRKPALFFCGDPAYAPNADALRWFFTEVCPLLKVKYPGLHLAAAGGTPPPDLRNLGAGTVEWLGRVDDVHVLYDTYAIFINPMRQGGGTRLKMLEAMAHGMACVSTSVGAEGIEIESGQHALIADTPEQFAAAIENLHANPENRAAIGVAARELIAKTYTWPHTMQELIKWCDNA